MGSYANPAVSVSRGADSDLMKSAMSLTIPGAPRGDSGCRSQPVPSRLSRPGWKPATALARRVVDDLVRRPCVGCGPLRHRPGIITGRGESHLECEPDRERIAFGFSFGDHPERGARQVTPDRHNAIPTPVVVSSDRIEHFTMLRFGVAAPPRPGVTELIEAKIALRSLCEVLDLLNELITCAPNKYAMELAVSTPPFGEVFMLGGAPHAFKRLLSGPYVVIRQHRNRKSGGERFRQNSGRIDEFEIARIEALDAWTLVGLGVDQPFFFEHAERLAERSATDAEGTGQPQLRKHAARWERSVEDELSKARVDCHPRLPPVGDLQRLDARQLIPGLSLLATGGQIRHGCHVRQPRTCPARHSEWGA